MDHPAALHRLRVGVPATVEHSSEAGPETGKWVAETTQVWYIPLTWFNDSSEPCYRALLRLWMRWNFECVPRISYIRFYGNLLLAMHGSREAKTGKAGVVWSHGMLGNNQTFPLTRSPSTAMSAWVALLTVVRYQADHPEWNESLRGDLRRAVSSGALSLLYPIPGTFSGIDLRKPENLGLKWIHR